MLSKEYAKTLFIDAVETGCTGCWSLIGDYSATRGCGTWNEMDDDGNILSKHDVDYTTIQYFADDFTKYALEHLPGIQLDWDDMDSEMLDCLIQYICFGEVRYG